MNVPVATALEFIQSAVLGKIHSLKLRILRRKKMYDKKENMVHTITKHLHSGDIEQLFQYFPILEQQKPRMKCRGDVQIDRNGIIKPKD